MAENGLFPLYSTKLHNQSDGIFKHTILSENNKNIPVLGNLPPPPCSQLAAPLSGIPLPAIFRGCICLRAAVLAACSPANITRILAESIALTCMHADGAARRKSAFHCETGAGSLPANLSRPCKAFPTRVSRAVVPLCAALLNLRLTLRPLT